MQVLFIIHSASEENLFLNKILNQRQNQKYFAFYFMTYLNVYIILLYIFTILFSISLKYEWQGKTKFIETQKDNMFDSTDNKRLKRQIKEAYMSWQKGESWLICDVYGKWGNKSRKSFVQKWESFNLTRLFRTKAIAWD